MQQLCLAGADVESPTGAAENPPLITAASHGSLVTVDALLASGADPTVTNRLGTTALAAACRRQAVGALLGCSVLGGGSVSPRPCALWPLVQP